MTQMWLAARYLAERAHCRARKALRGDPECGALSLEWIVIAVLVAAAAVVVGGLITTSINNEANKLP
jgi:Flp pilus assembly pilin Flp